MTPQAFIAKWQKVNLSERSACQQHFLDLCELLDQPKPAAADPEGEWYTFEKGVKKTDGGDGWADVWMRGHFGWEYKRKHRDLKEAYSQLLLYREDLENPPLLVVCDMDRFQVHTNFTATAKRTYEFDLAGLAEPANLDVLRKLFTEPDALRPGSPARRSPSRGGRAVRRLGRTAADAEGGIGPAGGPLPDEADVLHVRRGHQPAAAETLWPPLGDRQGQSGDAHAAAGNPLPGHGRGRRFRQRR